MRSEGNHPTKIGTACAGAFPRASRARDVPVWWSERCDTS